jgi:predicted DNA-binding transcriptional regulator AlpA
VDSDSERYLVDIHEASRLTGLSIPTLYRISRLRKIRSFKVLNSLRFDRADLLALVRENTPNNMPLDDPESRR